MDEVSLGAATMVGEYKDGEIREYEIHPEDFGFAMASNRSLFLFNVSPGSGPAAWAAVEWLSNKGKSNAAKAHSTLQARPMLLVLFIFLACLLV